MQEDFSNILEFLKACKQAGMAHVRYGDVEASFFPHVETPPTVVTKDDPFMEMPEDIKESMGLK